MYTTFYNILKGMFWITGQTALPSYFDNSLKIASMFLTYVLVFGMFFVPFIYILQHIIYRGESNTILCI